MDSGLTLGWTYDRYGNRWAQNVTGTGNATAVSPQLTFSGNNNRIDGWSYNAVGNLLYDNIHHYTYDAENRIATIDGAPAYLYDAEGRRVAKLSSSGTVTTSYILGLGGEQLSEINASGAWAHSNLFVGGKLMATYEGPGGSAKLGYHFHLTDWLGTQRVQTGYSGTEEELCYSYPFGDGLSCTGTDATEHHFTSKERDTESGLDYFGARYLSSNLGRFLTPDWAFKPVAVPYAKYGNPQSLNLYAYVLNNPLLAVDPDGHDCTSTGNSTTCNSSKSTTQSNIDQNGNGTVTVTTTDTHTVMTSNTDSDGHVTSVTTTTTTTTTVAEFTVNNYSASPFDGTQTTQTHTETHAADPGSTIPRAPTVLSQSDSPTVQTHLSGFQVAGTDHEGMVAANDAAESAKPFGTLRKIQAAKGAYGAIRGFVDFLF